MMGRRAWWVVAWWVGAAVGHTPPPTTRRRFVRVGFGGVGLLGGSATSRALPGFEGRSPRLPTVPRQRLEPDLAILLMRSGYNTVDDLDFVPMDAFQKRFFLLRQGEWQSYYDSANAQLGAPPTQGDLADPLYFDFISYCQTATINEFLAKPKEIFQELAGAEGESTVIARANGVQNDGLALEYSTRLGKAMLAFLVDRFGDIDLAPTAEVEENVRRLLGWLCVVLGFALEATVQVDGPTLTCRVVAPVNLWGLRRTLSDGGGPLTNDYVSKLVAAYLTQLGYRVPAPLPRPRVDTISTTHVFKLAR